MPKLLVTYYPTLLIFLHTHPHTSKKIYNQLFVNYIHLILMPKVNICALDQKCVQKFQHHIKHQHSPIHHKQKNKLQFRSPIFSLNNILLLFHMFNMLIIILFCLCAHESVRIWNLNTFLQEVSLCPGLRLFFSLHLPIHTSPFPSPTHMWLVVLPPILLWIVVLLPQQCSPPSRPSASFKLPQIVVPHLHLPPILQ